MNPISDNLSGMDQQHHRLGELLKAACSALKGGADSDEVGGILTRLLGFTRIHFSQEEDLMRRYRYEGLRRHIEAHRMLFDRLAALTGEVFHDFGESTRARLLDFLAQDLHDHIASDRHAWESGQLEKRFAHQRLRDHEAQLRS